MGHQCLQVVPTAETLPFSCQNSKRDRCRQWLTQPLFQCGDRTGWVVNDRDRPDEGLQYRPPQTIAMDTFGRLAPTGGHDVVALQSHRGDGPDSERLRRRLRQTVDEQQDPIGIDLFVRRRRGGSQRLDRSLGDPPQAVQIGQPRVSGERSLQHARGGRFVGDTGGQNLSGQREAARRAAVLA